MLRKPLLHAAKGDEIHFHTSSNNSFNGYARSFNFLSKLMDGLIRVLVGVGVNVGPHSRQLNCKHKLRALMAHGMTENGQYTLLSLVLCFAGKRCSRETCVYGKKMNSILGKWHLVYMWRASSSYLEKHMTVLSWNDAQLKIPLCAA